MPPTYFDYHLPSTLRAPPFLPTFPNPTPSIYFANQITTIIFIIIVIYFIYLYILPNSYLHVPPHIYILLITTIILLYLLPIYFTQFLPTYPTHRYILLITTIIFIIIIVYFIYLYILTCIYPNTPSSPSLTNMYIFIWRK